MGRPRLAIGPANYAGQAYAWAEAVNRHLDADAVAMTADRRGAGFQFDSHRRIPRWSFYNPLLSGSRSRRLLRPYSHVILDGYRTLFYDRSGRGFRAQAELVKQHGPALGLLAHGSDVRDPDAHLSRLPHSYFTEGGQAWVDERRAITARNRETARSVGVPLFVSTPDLLRDLPDASWVPVCVDAPAFATERTPLARRVPKVLFVPSWRQPPIKGTRYIEPVLQGLAASGRIEYLAATGVPHAQMIDLVKDADIVVDQVQSGFYGVAAVEALAAGRVVIGSIEGLGDVMPELPPILDASPATLLDVLEGVLTAPDAAAATAAAGPAFVARWHDGRESARRLAGFLGLPDRLAR